VFHQDQLKRALPPVLSGLFVAASFPRTGLWALAWVAWVPLIAALGRARGRREAFGAGLLAGGISTFLLLAWIPGVMVRYGSLPPVAAWGAYVLVALLLACYPAAACLLVKHLMLRGGGGWVLAFPAAWVLGEYALSFSPFGGFPWLLAGYTQADRLPVIQVADLAGVYGVSALVMAVNTAVACALTGRGWFRRLAPLGGAAVLLASALLYGELELKHWGKVEPRYEAAMLQGNLHEGEPEAVLADKFQRGYVAMADRLPPGEIDLLVLPESPAPKLWALDDDYRREMQALARRYPLGLILSNIRLEGERYYNSAFFLDRRGALAGIYDKVHLVPFGEYIPAARLFSFLETISRDVGAFSAGRRHAVFPLGEETAAALVCFEAVFPSLVRKFARDGGRLLVNITNDGWYGASAAPWQHLAISRFRAVENRRFFLRAANSGVTACIEPTGRIQSATGILQRAVGRGRFAFVRERSFYTRYGDVFVFLCAMILLVSIVLTERKLGFLRRGRCSRN
jgi:apolipoprotein N-acyltransferase